MDKISYTTPHYYPKYEIWTTEKKLVNNPFKMQSIAISLLVFLVSENKTLSRVLEMHPIDNTFFIANYLTI